MMLLARLKKFAAQLVLRVNSSCGPDWQSDTQSHRSAPNDVHVFFPPRQSCACCSRSALS